eukprot:2858061-Rhodomonas_salina.2
MGERERERADHEDGEEEGAREVPDVDPGVHVIADEDPFGHHLCMELEVAEDAEAVGDGCDLEERARAAAEAPRHVEEGARVEAKHDEEGAERLESVEDGEQLGPEGRETPQEPEHGQPSLERDQAHDGAQGHRARRFAGSSRQHSLHSGESRGS